MSWVFGFVLATGCTQTSSTDTTAADDDGGTTNPTTSTTATTAADGSSGSQESSGGDEAVTTASGTTAAETTDTGDSECGAAAQCVGQAPAGWFGPTIYARVTGGTDAPPCPDSFSAPGPTVLDGFNDPGPAICTCECQLSGGGNCIGYGYGSTTAQCNYDYNYYIPSVTESCASANIPNHVQYFAYSNGNPPVCMKQDETELPTTEWEAEVHSCKLAQITQACDAGNGICTGLAADGFEDNVCVYKDGDNECPGGDYTVKHLFYTDVDDTRGCSTCQCGSVSANCTQNMQVFTGSDCAGDPVALVPPNGACTAAVGGSVAMESATDTQCPVTMMSAPEGAIAPIGPFTFCCRA